MVDELVPDDNDGRRRDAGSAGRQVLPLAKAWGGGLLASVDGLRFVVPARTLNAGPSPKYFGYRRGLTWLNAVNDQVAGIGATVVPGTPRDSLYILDTLLNLDAGPKPEVIATDEASYSDMACDEDSCRILSQLIRSGRSPVAGGRLVVR